MSKLELKKHLSTLEKSEVIEIMLDLYVTRKEVKEYFEYYLNPNEKEQFEKYKQIILNEYYPHRGEPKTRLSVCKKAISEFSKLHPSVELEADLMIFLVVCGCQFTNDYGDMWEQFYSGMEGNFERALKFAAKNGVLERVKPQADLCLKYADSCGWGFPDTLGEIYFEFYQ